MNAFPHAFSQERIAQEERRKQRREKRRAKRGDAAPEPEPQLKLLQPREPETVDINKAEERPIWAIKADVAVKPEEAKDFGLDRDDEMFTWDLCLVFRVGEADKEIELDSDDEFAPPQQHAERKEEMEVGGNSDGEALAAEPPKRKVNEVEHFKRTTMATVTLLRDAGLHVCLFQSVQKDEIYCLVGASEERLEDEADRQAYELELDTEELLRQGARNQVKLCLAVLNGELPRDNWMRMYGPYRIRDPAERDRLLVYKHFDEGPLHHDTVFRTVDRLKLTDDIIEADKMAGGADFSTGRAIADENHSLMAYFPLHQPDRLAEIDREWIQWNASLDQPIEKLRDYFGEKVAIYFAFLGFYCKSLLLPALIGFGIFIAQLAVGKIEIEALPFYGVFVAFYTTGFLEVWKRKEARLRVDWGMSNFATKEQPRPEYSGELKRNEIDGHLEKSFPPLIKFKRMLFSQTVIWTLIGVVIGSVVSIFILRKVLNDWNSAWGSILTAIINAVQIQVLNFVYGKVSRTLNDYENHRTETEYENSLIAKSFLFKFVNSYNSLFYIAFFKRYDDFVGGCINNDCLRELQRQLLTIMIVNIVVNNAVEVISVRAKLILAQRAQSASSTDESGYKTDVRKSRAEQDFERGEFESTFDDFDELAIQYGFVSLFVVAFPLAPLLALVNNYIEIRLDAMKVARYSRRPEPRGATNIGTWFTVFEVVGFISVITNAAIIVFQTPIVDEWTDGSTLVKVWTFLVLEHVIFAIKLIIGAVVPDEPYEVLSSVLRQNFLSQVLIDGEPLDPKDEASVGGGGAVARKGPPIEANFDWDDVTKGGAELFHSWEFNSYANMRRRLKFAPNSDEMLEWRSDDALIRMLLRDSMQEQCVGGGFALQPPAFWMLYDLYYLGTLFAVQVIFNKFRGNDRLTEGETLIRLHSEGGVKAVAFRDERFIKFLKFWVQARRPRWCLYLQLDPRQADRVITSEWLLKVVERAEALMYEWRFDIDVDPEDGIVVQPLHR